MIEVEKKFALNIESKRVLMEGADFLNEHTFKDSYFDDADFSLTTKDIWLRNREGRYEIKLPLSEKTEKRIVDQYRELEADKEIADYFKWDLSKKTFVEYMKQRGYEPFVTYITTRRKYKKGEFIIDIDETDFGFGIIEIELLVENQEQVQEAVQKILDFSSDCNLEIEYVRGKVLEYIQLNNPEHLQKLIDAGVVK